VDPSGWTTANQYATPLFMRKDAVEHRFHASAIGAWIEQRAKRDFALAFVPEYTPSSTDDAVLERSRNTPGRETVPPAAAVRR
jgi:hypothetical protein